MHIRLPLLASGWFLLRIFTVTTYLRYLQTSPRHAATHALKPLCGIAPNNPQPTLDDSPFGFPVGDSLVASAAMTYLAISQLPDIVETEQHGWTGDSTGFHLFVMCRAAANFQVSLQRYLSQLGTVFSMSSTHLAMHRNLVIAALHSSFELEVQLDELERRLAILTAPTGSKARFICV
ncbi:hypothetical protein EDD17DRAFT_1507946 [Pisolithus thermaeus]|nr:hypothetical protein EV401DRAFT_2065434 [Pisolithus croceorrhizus]KAI6162495.1 hypothetical protein EDD17DRAFT_1507946 [Pisolithus thermaeus]